MNVKPGDIAIIIATQNAGSIVEVIEFCGDAFGLKDMWRIRPTNKLKTWDGVITGSDGICRDAILRPVSGLPDVDVIETEKEIEHADNL
jgi:hypothetical protein